MKLDISNVKIEMTIQEANDLSQQLLEVFHHFSQAINSAGGNVDEEFLKNDYPEVLKLMHALNVRLPTISSDLPF